MTYGLLMFMLLALSIIDLKTSRVPNQYVIGMLLVLGFSTVMERQLFNLCWKSIVLSLFLSMMLYKYRVLGAADLKIFIVISPFFNESALVFILLCAMFIFTLVMLLIRKLKLLRTISRLSVGIVDHSTRMPFVWSYVLPVTICSYKIVQYVNG